MRPIVTFVTHSGLCVCVVGTRLSCPKRMNRSRCRLGRLAESRGSKKPCRWSQNRTNPFVAAGMTSRRCGLLLNYCRLLFSILFTFTRDSYKFPLLYESLKLVINGFRLWAIVGPQLRRKLDESFALQQSDCVVCNMRQCGLSAKRQK